MNWTLSADSATRERLQVLSGYCALPSMDNSTPVPDASLQLVLIDDALCLRVLDEPSWEPIQVNFLEGVMAHRQRGHVGSEHVVKAVRGRSVDTLTVLDATAGLGRDCFMLALAGFRVIACERHPVVASLLADGLWRAAASERTAEVVSRIECLAGSAFNAMMERSFDVACLDPMFPERDKTALVKKEMRAFKRLVGPDDDAQALLALARQRARLRVVVKRPASAPPLAAGPSHSLSGKAGRFDVYACANQAADLPSGSAGRSS